MFPYPQLESVQFKEVFSVHFIRHIKKGKYESETPRKAYSHVAFSFGIVYF